MAALDSISLYDIYLRVEQIVDNRISKYGRSMQEFDAFKDNIVNLLNNDITPKQILKFEMVKALVTQIYCFLSIQTIQKIISEQSKELYEQIVEEAGLNTDSSKENQLLHEFVFENLDYTKHVLEQSLIKMAKYMNLFEINYEKQEDKIIH